MRATRASGSGLSFGNCTAPFDDLYGAEIVAFLDQFDPSDPGWIEVVWEKLKTAISGKAKFVKHKTVTDFRFPIEAQTRIALVSDWGTGTRQAQDVAKRTGDLKPDHAIHLGDVYYAGTKTEIKGRFLKYWSGGSSHSWALNSNHEMYSGGHGYFEETLKSFKQPASYFNLWTKDWQIVALDTGYVDRNLNKEQADWLSAQLKRKSIKTIRQPPETDNADRSRANLSCYRWQKHCGGLYQTPIAA